LQLGWHELDQLIMTALHAVRGMSDIKGIGFDAQFEPKVKVWCDAGRIIQVLINLLSNAIKVSPNESTIVLKAMFAGNGAFRCEILDAGPGIAEDQKDKLFQKFSQLSDPGAAPGSGKGLGLYICRQLVGAHGGEIGISASGASGSCFWFEIPQVQTDAAGAQTT